jgi:tyrosyl-tRNA synthetase
MFWSLNIDMKKAKKPVEKWDKIEQALDRYADKIYPSKKAFLDKIKKDKIRIYIGIDPTGPDLHLGHSTNFFVLKALQELGHKVILLIGDFTARIGDPTDKLATRKRLNKAQVLKNAKTYKKQIENLINFKGRNKAEIKFNSKWLAKLSFEDVIELAAHTTVDQLKKRDMFKEREKKAKVIYLHEFLYPLMQGYDSVAMGVDAELGGTDQTFNMLVGRNLVKSYSGKEKFVITTKLLINPKTDKKIMSKSEGNYVSLQDKPQDMFGKVMALPDETIIPCLTFCTQIPLSKILKLKQKLKRGENPMSVKKIIAEEIVKIYHGADLAEKAMIYFEKKYQSAGKKERGDIAEKINVKQKISLIDLILKLKSANSRAQAKRLIKQGGVRVNGKKIININYYYDPKKDDIIEIGKHKIFKVKS